MESHPAWIQSLADQITPGITPLGIPSPIGCHTFFDDTNDVWEISLFTSETEILGGEKDGIKFHSNFVLNINSLLHVFDEIENIEWQALTTGEEDQLGSHLSVEGTFQTHSVWLRILSNPPEACDVGQIYDHQSQKLLELW